MSKRWHWLRWMLAPWLVWSVQASEREVYGPALEEAPWQFVQEGQQCHLAQSIPRVGEAVFALNRDQQLSFSLNGFRHPAGDTLALIRLDPPAWQHGQRAESLQEIRLSPSGELAKLQPRLANRLLQELEHGRIVSLFFPDWADAQHALTIRLLPVGFRPALRKFLACPEQLPPPPKVELPPEPPRYTLWFATDRAELTEDAVQQIGQICEAIRQYGPAVEQVLLQGRADERGEEAYNLQLSEARAQAVAESLLACGLDEQKLKLQALGENQPDPPGSAVDAWRRNRRVEVVLLGRHGQAPQRPPTEEKAEPAPGQPPPLPGNAGAEASDAAMNPQDSRSP